MENVIRVYAKLMKNEKGTYYNCSTVLKDGYYKVKFKCNIKFPGSKSGFFLVKVDLKDTKKYKLIGKAASLKVDKQDYNRLLSYSMLRMNLRVGTIARIPVGDSFTYFVVIKEDTTNEI